MSFGGYVTDWQIMSVHKNVKFTTPRKGRMGLHSCLERVEWVMQYCLR